jgi:hypothetical protein
LVPHPKAVITQLDLFMNLHRGYLQELNQTLAL